MTHIYSKFIRSAMKFVIPRGPFPAANLDHPRLYHSFCHRRRHDKIGLYASLTAAASRCPDGCPASSVMSAAYFKACLRRAHREILRPFRHRRRERTAPRPRTANMRGLRDVSFS
jgi:hypothetical protein